MSQYSYPPNYGFPPVPPDLGAPSRRAGTLMMIIGGLILLLGGCVGMGSRVPLDQMSQEIRDQAARMEQQTHLSWNLFWQIATIFILVPGLLNLVIGFFVRRGGFTSAILGIILTGLQILLAAYLLLSAMYAVAMGNVVGAIPALVFCGAVTGLFVLMMFWLAKAAINAGPMKLFNQHQQAYAWQMYQQQQQQAYAQQQYPYPPPPPPPGS